MPPLSVAQLRAVDRLAVERFGMASLVLMENAGRGAAEVLLAYEPQRVLVVCGKGNNGGDGLVVARHLHAAGVAVVVLLAANRKQVSTDAAANLRILTFTSVPLLELPAGAALPDWADSLKLPVDWVVDGLLGTGGDEPPREPVAGLIRWINSLPARRMALDLPSGLVPDSGRVHDPTLRADVTCTFVAPKLGFATPAAQEVLGEVQVLPIGVPPEVIAQAAER